MQNMTSDLKSNEISILEYNGRFFSYITEL